MKSENLTKENSSVNLIDEFAPGILQQVTFTIFGRIVVDYYYQGDPSADDYILQDLEEYFAREFNEKPTFHKVETFKRSDSPQKGNNILKQVNFTAEVTYATDNSFERKSFNNTLHFSNSTELEAINQVIKLYPISNITSVATYELVNTSVISNPNEFDFKYFKPVFLKTN